MHERLSRPFFFRAVFRRRSAGSGHPASQQSAADIVAALGWDLPGSPDDLADRWVQELDRAGVGRAALIAQRPGRRSVGRAGGCAASVALRRFLHARSDGAGCSVAHRTRARAARAALHLSVPGHAALFAARSAGEGDRGARREARRAPRCSCTAARCRSACERNSGCPAGLTCVTAIRSTCMRSPPISRRAVHHPALRRGAVSRGVARRRSLPERVPRHVEHQPVDVVSPRACARRRLPAGARGCRPGAGRCSAQIRHFFRAGGTERSTTHR